VIVLDDDENDETFATPIEDGTYLDHATNEDEEVEDRGYELLDSDSQYEDATDEVVEYGDDEEDDGREGDGEGGSGSTE